MTDKIAQRREREREVLSALEAAPRSHNGSKGWMTPYYCGGWDASWHSRVLRSLVPRGLVEKKERGGWTKTSWLYRITPAGRRYFKRLKAEAKRQS